jgi:hypothetical protein
LGVGYKDLGWKGGAFESVLFWRGIGGAGDHVECRGCDAGAARCGVGLDVCGHGLDVDVGREAHDAEMLVQAGRRGGGSAQRRRRRCGLALGPFTL